MVELPENKTLIGVKWIFKVKLKPDGTIAKYKATLVAKDFMQKEGIYYTDFLPLQPDLRL